MSGDRFRLGGVWRLVRWLVSILLWVLAWRVATIYPGNEATIAVSFLLVFFACHVDP